LLVNASGSFLLGLVLTAVSRRTKPPDSLRLLVAVGFLGAYTTFSTFSVETLSLLQQQAYLAAALNVGGSVALALLAVACGALVGRWL
jgi:CrcB protein